MIKVPGTKEGIPAFQQLISEGININVTLLFSQEVYQKVAEAYLAGVENLPSRGGDLSKIASVASFFISRIDTAVDSRSLAARLKTSKDPSEQAQLKSLQGKVAIANGKLTYQRYQKIFAHRAAGRSWRPKAPRRSAFCGRAPARKIPTLQRCNVRRGTHRTRTRSTPCRPATLDAFRDHGHPRSSLTRGYPRRRADHENPCPAGHLD